MPNPDSLMSLCSPTLGSEILHMIKTHDGNAWADVTKSEAMHLAAHGAVLAGFLPNHEERSVESQAIIDDGKLAEALLGPLNVGGGLHYDFEAICATLKATTTGTEASQ